MSKKRTSSSSTFCCCFAWIPVTKAAIASCSAAVSDIQLNMSRLSVAYHQRMVLQLRGLVFAQSGAGVTTLFNALSDDKDNESLLTLVDKAANIEFQISIQMNPNHIKNPEEPYCVFVVYDVSSQESYDEAMESYYEVRTDLGQCLFFTLLIGNKCDLEKEVLPTEVMKDAQENQMFFIETSAPSKKNIDNIQRYIRVHVSQKMKKFNIQPHPKHQQQLVQIEASEQSESEQSESDQSSDQSQVTPPKFPQRAELSPEYQNSTPPPLPHRSDTESDYNDSGVTTPPQKKPTLIAELAQKPSIQKNLNARFKDAYKIKSPERNQKSPEKRQSPQKNPSPEKQQSNKKQQTSTVNSLNKNNYSSKQNTIEASKKPPQSSQHQSRSMKTNSPPPLQQFNPDDTQQNEPDELDQQIKQLEAEIQQIPQTTKRASENGNGRSESPTAVDISQTRRQFTREDSQYIPVVDTFLYDNKSEKSASTRLNITDFLNNTVYSQTTDPRLYSKKLKPILFLAIEHEQDFFTVEVYKDDTLTLVTERVLQQLKTTSKSNYIKRYLSAILEHEIGTFNKELSSQLQLIEKRKLNKKEALENSFKNRVDLMKQSIQKIKSNWTNPKNSIGKVSFAMPRGQPPLVLYVHEHDDPYDLAFYFIMDNDLKKSKIQQIVNEIIQIQQNYTPSEEEEYIFKANFNVGGGRSVAVNIRAGEDINKCVHKIVLENQLKYEQYTKMLQIIKSQIRD